MNVRPHVLVLGLLLGLCLPLSAQNANKPEGKPTRFHFREPRQKTYLIDEASNVAGRGKADWIKARPENDPENPVEIGSRVVLQLKSADQLKAVLNGSSLEVSRQISLDTFILQAADPITAMREAERLAGLPEVAASSPIMKRALRLHAAQAPIPNDPLFGSQWNLEQTNGIDLNIREAWAQSPGLGAGVTIAIVDDGVELAHPDLIARGNAALHYHFGTGTTNGGASATNDIHATPVAGLAVAEMNNTNGIAGVAPGSKFASWKIFNGPTIAASDEQLGDMYKYSSNQVAIQNHSWGFNSAALHEPSLPEKIGIDIALASGRAGKGTIMVRSIPDRRANLGNANDDGYPSNPGVIAVAGLRSDGRVASYSNPGACILVGAPGGEFSFDTLVSTDRQGEDGYNTNPSPEGDYSLPNGQGQSGTSFAAPQVAGIAALMLSLRPNLTYRDVQQILVHSARRVDFADADLSTNGAGFTVSHNDGFGLPDAGVAVSLATFWPNRPAVTSIEIEANETNSVQAPDDGLRVLVAGAPSGIASIPATAGMGKYPYAETAVLPLVDFGFGTNTVGDLTGKAALIERGNGTFATKINNAATAGAAFAVIFNNSGTSNRTVMLDTEYTAIPAVFIGKNDGDALREYLQTNGTASAQLKSFDTNVTFTVTNTLSCEHVAVSVELDCRRSDARVTLTSPSGTKSVLQRVNNDSNTVGLVVWTYTTTHHFYESSAGTWTLSVEDQTPGQLTTLHKAQLKIYGVEITDSDADGLDDSWEMVWFGKLANGPTDDSDDDLSSNIREYILGTDPADPQPPIITQQAPSRTVSAGSTVLFSPTITGTEPLTYQWRFNKTNIDGATNAFLELVDVQVTNSGKYSVAVENFVGSTVSSNTTLIVVPCSYTLSSNSTHFGYRGGTGSFSMTASNTCSWEVFTTNDWITLTSAFGGVGDTTVSYTVATNSGVGRIGHIEIAGMEFAVVQDMNIVPATMGGKTLTLIITNGTGSFASSGSYLFITGPLAETYSIVPLSGSTAAGAGDYTLATNELLHGVLTLDGSTTLTLEFLTLSSGRYFAMNGANTQGGTFQLLPTITDFDANSRDDFVFQNTNTAALATWLMNGSDFAGSASFSRNGPKDWQLVGQGDFNGDRQSDLLFRHKAGRLAAWLMNGTQFISSIALRNNQALATGWKNVGTADLNADGHTDIIFQHDVGLLAAWYFNGTNYTSTSLLRDGTPIGKGWRGVGAGDFNKDGRADILFQRNDGKLAAWFMNDSTYLGTGLLRDGKAATGWSAAGVADVNSDGKSDVLFQNGTSRIAVWYMDGTNYLNGQILRDGVGSGKPWRLAAPR